MGGIDKTGEMPNFNKNNNEFKLTLRDINRQQDFMDTIDSCSSRSPKKNDSRFNSAKKSQQLNKWDFIACTFATLGSAYALYQTNFLPLRLAGLTCLSGITIKVVQMPMINKIIKMETLGNKADQLSSRYWRRGISLTMVSSALIGLAALKYIPNQTILSQELVGRIVGLVGVQTLFELGVFLYQLKNAAKSRTTVNR